MQRGKPLLFPSFRLRDASVYLYECSLSFWVGSYLQRELPCLLFYVDMRIQIDTALKHFYTCML